MSSNREMSEKDTMSLIGKLLPEGAGRDAIHIAVAPVTASESLRPGTHVALIADSARVMRCAPGKGVGIIDPYLPATTIIKAGERVFVFLYPQTITSLRHEWTHPMFPLSSTTTDVKSASEVWLRDFAEHVGVSYPRLLDIAAEYIETGESEVLSYNTPDRVYDDGEAFWNHYAAVTGTLSAIIAKRLSGATLEFKTAPFSCSC